MKFIITEEQYSKYIKPETVVIKTVNKYLDSILRKTKRIVVPKSRNYGNISVQYCKNNNMIMQIYYYYGDEIPNDGSLYIYDEIFKEIHDTFKLRKTVVSNLIIDWYVDNYLAKDRLEFGDNTLEIDDIVLLSGKPSCYEDFDTSNMTREEMLDFIYKNTLYGKPEKDDLSDEDLRDLYIQIKNIVKDKEDI